MGHKILIVDDERAVRHMMKRMLHTAGYEIDEADDGLTGLEKAKNFCPDLVLTDLKMPGMNGLDMARHLLSEDKNRPVLLMTAYADLESARKALRIGIYEYFLKPVDMQDLLAGIKRGLEFRRLTLENKAYQEDLERKVVERTRDLKQKIEDLEARDALLKNLLSVQEPHASLGFAVKLALSLCDGHFGVLYTPDKQGNFILRAGVGFGALDAILPQDELGDLALEKLPNTQKMLEQIRQQNDMLIPQQIDEIRQGYGMGSLGVMPVKKKDAAIAFLEVGKKEHTHPISEGDLQRLKEFLPYIAMAVDDCLLQEELPQWEGDVENLLNETTKWAE